VQDLSGGHVSTVTYESRDPITKTLRSFGLDLTDNPSQGQLLNQLRGERVEILWPGKIAGTIVGIEKREQRVDDKSDRTIQSEYLNVLTDDGLQSIPLAQVQKVKLLNERLNSELRQALEVLASGHDTQKKAVSIAFDGEGKRKVSVSYIAQTPVWKTSYRLVLGDKDKPFLQGWAIVENTSDEDWENARISLVSGRPISFVMDLYQPLYTTRPTVEPEQYLSLRPQVYGEAMEAEALDKPKQEVGLAVAGANGTVRGVGGMAFAPGAADQMGRRNLAEAKKTALLTDVLSASVASAAETREVGELFQYEIKAPVSLARQKSAMLPIINETVAGDKLSIYNQNVQAKYPLNGFRLKNTTALHLMQGPITVFDAGTYAGDARIEDVAPGEERLISYGLDLKVEVEPQYSGKPNELLTVKIRKGTLIATRKATEEHTYNVRNRDQKEKTVLIEHPFRADWHLAESKTKPERTRDMYRFPVSVEPDKTAKLTVREEKQVDERVALINSPDDTILLYARSQKVSPKVQESLRQVLSLREKLSRTTAERTRNEQLRAEISQEQTRIRENMQRLNQSSDLYTRYVKKLDQQETDLENLRQQIEQLKDTETKQQRDLNDYLNNLSLD
ncbi:MAG TPA: hypothetical protein VGR78_03415, partial [Verrucomicrobiae bacterium]|jgi:hypothetical protein|nr:hypothetical protein [Verrucomicrobiae bacterium]